MYYVYVRKVPVDRDRGTSVAIMGIPLTPIFFGSECTGFSRCKRCCLRIVPTWVFPCPHMGIPLTPNCFGCECTGFSRYKPCCFCIVPTWVFPRPQILFGSECTGFSGVSLVAYALCPRLLLTVTFYAYSIIFTIWVFALLYLPTRPASEKHHWTATKLDGQTFIVIMLLKLWNDNQNWNLLDQTPRYRLYTITSQFLISHKVKRVQLLIHEPAQNAVRGY